MKLKPHSSREIEILQELAVRELHWKRRVSLVEEFHNLKIKELGQAESHRPFKSLGKLGWSIKDTALALGRSVGSVSQDISIARLLPKDNLLQQMLEYRDALEYYQARKREGSNGSSGR